MQIAVGFFKMMNKMLIINSFYRLNIHDLMNRSAVWMNCFISFNRPPSYTVKMERTGRAILFEI